jgi:uncharacterized protein YndB with AHSA1/START domain
MDVCPTDIILAPAEHVWRLVTDPQELARWLFKGKTTGILVAPIQNKRGRPERRDPQRSPCERREHG